MARKDSREQMSAVLRGTAVVEATYLSTPMAWPKGTTAPLQTHTPAAAALAATRGSSDIDVGPLALWYDSAGVAPTALMRGIFGQRCQG